MLPPSLHHVFAPGIPCGAWQKRGALPGLLLKIPRCLVLAAEERYLPGEDGNAGAAESICGSPGIAWGTVRCQGLM